MLIYVPKLTNRLGYTLNVVFRNVLRADFEITTDAETFAQRDDAVLCYGPQRVGDRAVWVKSCDLLFQTTIEEQEPHPFVSDGVHALFPVYGRDLDFPFDLLAATFYMVSRYEEYLPHHTDMHGRFVARESIAYQEGFLRTPVVDQWARMIERKINERFPDTHFQRHRYDLLTTIDIDAAYCYKHKGAFRTMAGFVRDLFLRRDTAEVRRRWRVITRREDDPYDTFDYILDQKERHPGNPMVFFVLLADYGMFDKNISYHNDEFCQLIKHLGDYAKIGLHTSYASFNNPDLVETETQRLADITHRNIVRNRSHFLRLQLPETYRTLLHAGIRHDYTMGYAEEPGFRAGISVQFPFYNLERDSEMPLTIHPFSLMEGTLKRYHNMQPEEAWEVYKELMENVKAVDGTFCCIWHNENLCDDFGWQGWRQVFEQMLDYSDELKTRN